LIRKFRNTLLLSIYILSNQEKYMPRLVGKQSNNELLAGLTLVAILGATVVGAEYYGYTNFIPEWGKTLRAESLDIKLPTAFIVPASNYY
jgi:heme/copper-type cytochrome/quinol oxidase subunit 3